MSKNELPQIFLDRLEGIIPAALFLSVKRSFALKRSKVFRVNTLKSSCEDVEALLANLGIDAHPVVSCPNAFKFCPKDSKLLQGNDLLEQGMVYYQGLSSQLVPMILDPKPTDRVLDLCSAPGSKTTQMAAMMNNQGVIVAIEKVRQRFFKLKAILGLLGVQNVQAKLMDGRKFKSQELFDKVLVDAPCSSEARFSMLDKKSFAYWSLRKIKEMQKKQKGLLLHASRMVALNGTLVYSTCSFAPEENEVVVDWFLRKTNGMFQVVSCDSKNLPTYPALLKWKEKVFNPQIKESVRILPTEELEGFFITKFMKVSE